MTVFSKHTNEVPKVVITGLGVVSSIGLTLAEVTKSLKTGRTGIDFCEDRKSMGFRSGLSGTIKGFTSQYPIERRYRKTLPEYGMWAWDAICQALDHSRLSFDIIENNTRVGLIFGNDSSVVSGVEQCELLKNAENTREIGSGHIFRLLTSTITLNLSTRLKIKGSSWTVSGACASGAMSIGQGADLIEKGEHDIVICGGAQEISWQSMCSFDALGAFSTQEKFPYRASRPFDISRDGLIPSGGAAALILESRESALLRGVPILGELQGVSTTSDGGHLSVPTGEGLYRAMKTAIINSGVAPEDISLIMAHATSTPLGDEKEAEAICKMFGIQVKGDGPKIAATKSLTGHEFWMAGASQVVYGLLMAKNEFIAGHPNFEKGEGFSGLLQINSSTEHGIIHNILCNAAGFGGVNASLLIHIPHAS